MADRSVKVTIGANVAGLQAGLRSAKASVADFTGSAHKSFLKNRESLDQLAGSALKVGTGLTVAAGFAVKAAMDWETAWTGVLKTVDGTGAELNALEGDLRDLAKETGFAHAEVAAVGEAAGQLGISTTGIAAFTETMLAMGVSTNLGAEEAATGLARFRNIMGSSEADVSRMGATIVGLGNNFATTEREILEMSMRLAGAGKQAGLTEADVMGVAASMSSVGIEAEAGGTAMSLTMKRIGKEVDSGGAKLGTFASLAGMSSADFSKAWKDNAGKALTEFIGGLDEASKSGQSVNQILTDLGITGIREADAILRLSGNVEGLKDSLGVAGEGWEQNIALMAEAEKFYGTTEQKAKQAWATFKDSAIDAGQGLLPVLSKMLDGISDVIEVLNKIPQPIKTAATGIAGVGGAGLIAAAGLIKFAGFVRDTTNALTDMGMSGGKAKGVIAGVGKAAGVAALAYGATAIGQQVASRNRKEMSELTKDIEKFGKSGEWLSELDEWFGAGGKGVSNWVAPLESFGKSLEDVAKHGDDGTLGVLGNQLGQLFSAGHGGYSYNQVKAIKDMDIGLTQLARNKPEEAIKSYERLRDRALETGGSIETFAAAFPQMTEVVRGASESMGGTSDATEILEGNLQDLAPAAQASAEEMEALRQAASDQAASFMDFAGAAEKSKGSVSGFTSSLESQAKALRDFTKNAIEAGERGLSEGLVAHLRALGPEGAALMAQFSKASKSEIAKANKAFESGEMAIDDYVAEFGTVPESVKTKAEFDDKTARRKLEIFKSYVTSTGLTVPVKLQMPGQLPTLNDIYAPKPRANGGLDVYGRSVPRNPQIRSGSQGTVMWGEPETGWEAYISGKPGMKHRNQAILAQAAQRLGGVATFASGGFIEADSKLEYLQLQSRVNGLNKELNAKEKYGKKRKGKKRKTRYVVRGLDRQILKEELREAKAELAQQKKIYKQIGKGKKYKNAEAYNRAQEKSQESKEKKKEDDKKAKEDKAEAFERAQEAKRDLIEKAKEKIAEKARERASAKADYKSNFSLDKLTSPAAVERHLTKRLGEMNEFNTVLSNLKGRGASPWLLNELIQIGPNKGTIRLGKKYLADHQSLLRVNALAASADEISGAFGDMTTNANWNKTAALTQAARPAPVSVDYARIAELVRASPIPQMQLMLNGRQAGAIVEVGSEHRGDFK